MLLAYSLLAVRLQKKIALRERFVVVAIACEPLGRGDCAPASSRSLWRLTRTLLRRCSCFGSSSRLVSVEFNATLFPSLLPLRQSKQNVDRYIDDLFGVGPELRAMMVAQLVLARERNTLFFLLVDFARGRDAGFLRFETDGPPSVCAGCRAL